MNRDEYLWDPGDAPASSDDFAVQLERRLAPLADELDALVDELELEPVDEQELEQADEAVVLTLPVSPASAVAAERPRERSWPYLAAALVVLGVSVFTLAREQRRRLDAVPTVDVGGATQASARVELGVHAISGEPTAHAVLASLRDVHDELAGCALALAPGAALERRVGVRVEAGVAVVEPGALGDDPVERCVAAALAGWDATALGDAEIEIELLLQDQRSEESMQ